MKVLRIVLITVGVLIVVLGGAVFIFVKTFDVNRYKPMIIEQADKTLGRQVDFQKAYLGISLTHGVSVTVSGLSISEDPAFGKGDFLSVKTVSVGIDVLGYLLKKKVEISGVVIDSPKVTIIRTKDGALNVQTIAQPSLGKAGGGGGQASGSDLLQGVAFANAAASPAAPVALPELFISSLNGANGTVTYIDRSFEPAVNLMASDVSFKVDGLSLTRAFPFTVEAAVLSDKKNIRIEGTAQLDLKTNEVTVTDVKASSDLSSLIMSRIPATFPMAKGVSLPESLKGTVDVRVAKITAGPKGLGSLDADCSLTSGALQFKELASPVKDMEAQAKITEKKIVLTKASAAIGEGSIVASGVIDDYLSKQDYNATIDVQKLKIEDLAVQDKSQVKAEGIATATIKAKGSGFTPEALRSSASGDGEISVTKGTLKGVNVLRAVLGQISIIPGLAEKIEAALPERFKQKLAQKDTVLSDMKVPITIESGSIIVKETTFSADEFQFQGKGEAGISGIFSLEGSFFIPTELSLVMVAAVPQLQYLQNEQQQIFMPLKIKGRLGQQPSFHVDPQYLATHILQNQVKQQVFKALDKALGGKESGGSQTQEGSPDQSKQGKTGNILRGIFK